ncbi:MAG: class II glutamine amidotransferase [Thermoplasmatota archaeon]
MSRLMCIATKGIIPHQAMAAFKRLAREGRERPGEAGGHRSGWGIGYFPGGRLRLVRELGDAFSSVRYDETAHMTGSNPDVRLLLGHLWRSPSRELASSRERVGPFSGTDREGGEWVMAYDGSIGPSRESGEAYAPFPAKEMESQKVFREILGHLPPKDEGREAVAEALRSAVRGIFSEYAVPALNFALSDGRRIYLARFVERDEPWNELHISRTSKALVGCSEPLSVGDWVWEALPSRRLLIFDTDLNLTRHEI